MTVELNVDDEIILVHHVNQDQTVMAVVKSIETKDNKLHITVEIKAENETKDSGTPRG